METINSQTSEDQQKGVKKTEKEGQLTTGKGTAKNGRKADGNDRTGTKVLLNLLECVDAVHSLTGLNWEEIYRISAVDFIAYLNFWNYKQRKQQKAMDDFKRKNKIGNGR